jgi:very-short-patch-repair endonuclease
MPRQYLSDQPGKQQARTLRRQQTDAEGKLWYYLRNKRFYGLKFRRQFPIGPYVLDFYCDAKKLAIELDGGQHTKLPNIKKDKQRSQYLKEKGIQVIRFWDNEILQDIDGVLE